MWVNNSNGIGHGEDGYRSHFGRRVTVEAVDARSSGSSNGREEQWVVTGVHTRWTGPVGDTGSPLVTTSEAGGVSSDVRIRAAVDWIGQDTASAKPGGLSPPSTNPGP